MLTLLVPTGQESFDERTSSFVPSTTIPLELEHSLVSLSKWESAVEKPFLSTTEKSVEETLFYISCMSQQGHVPPEILAKVTNENIDSITKYINAPMTATTINNIDSKSSRETITAEIIYYWMISLDIPFECQNWHLSRLLTLIQVCNLKNAPQKKMSRSEIAAQHRKLNAERKAKFRTAG